MKKDLLNLTHLTKQKILNLIELAKKIKARPEKFKDALRQKTLLMIFEKSSLYTRVSFEVAMTRQE